MSKDDYLKFALVGIFCVCLLNVQLLGFLSNSTAFVKEADGT